MKYSQACTDLVKRSEDEPGFLAGRCTHLKAYQCPAGKWTCGWGTTRGVGRDTEFTQEQADHRLILDLNDALEVVREVVAVPLTQGQLDALVSFVQNIGPGVPDVKDGFVWLKKRDAYGQPQHSTILRKLLAQDYAGAVWEFGKWINVNGKPAAGLIVRRKREANLFGGLPDLFTEAV